MGNNREPFEPNTVYHVYNHGNAEDNIFREDTNYGFFLKRYRKYIPPIADTYAYCLMPNHFHFMVRIKSEEALVTFVKEKYPNKDPQSNKNPQGLRNPEGLSKKLSNLISHQFGTLFNSYTKSYNKFYDRRGSLFQNTFKRKSLTSNAYYIHLICYIHKNPIHHSFVDKIEDWPYSSYHSLLSKQPTKLKRKKALEWFGGRENFIQAHKRD
ncbi:hypothetical protein [Fodinibius sp.]|uniref:hypothetical protein n=1 Tax=Fodinibius sp. TaxID=1872440 RepID=UPI002ACDA2E6|nr:hypothetical protein [Fodinibius sp.]MDZ7658247.1 hypothetical protein [Fodinibius sp.]